MTDSKPPATIPDDPVAAARAFADRGTTTTNRISALVADAGLACRFRSIVASDGKPVAELALMFVPDGDTGHTEATILRKTRWAELVKGAVSFRQRAVAEFAAADLPASQLLFLPYYCTLPEVEATGPALSDVLESHRIDRNRVVAEILSPSNPSDLTSALVRVEWMRALHVRVAFRVQRPEEMATDALRAVAPDLVHWSTPPRSLDERDAFRAYLRDAHHLRARAVLGGLHDSEAALTAEGLGVDLFYGDALAPPRFLC